MLSLFLVRSLFVDAKVIYRVEIVKHRELIYESLHNAGDVEKILPYMTKDGTYDFPKPPAFRFDFERPISDSLDDMVKHQRVGIKVDMLEEIALMLKIASEENIRKKYLRLFPNITKKTLNYL